MMIEITAKYADDPDVRELVGRLIEGGREPSGALRRELVEGGDEVTRALIAMVEDRELADEEAPGGGWAAIRAAEVLGERGDEEAIGVLIDAVRDFDADAIISTASERALEKIGESVVEPVVDAFDEEDDPDKRRSLAGMLSRLGVRDERVRAELREEGDAMDEGELADRSGETYRKADREEVGRNDPCWCGSGRKYKHCHFREDNA